MAHGEALEERHPLYQLVKTEEDGRSALEIVREYSTIRLKGRNFQFGYPLSEERVEAIASGEIEPATPGHAQVGLRGRHRRGAMVRALSHGSEAARRDDDREIEPKEFRHGLQGFTVVDADSHFREYLDVDRTYRDNIDPEYRESFEKLSTAVAKRREAGLVDRPFHGADSRSSSRPMSGVRSASTTHLAPSAHPDAYDPRDADSPRGELGAVDSGSGTWTGRESTAA